MEGNGGVHGRERAAEEERGSGKGRGRGSDEREEGGLG